MKKLKDMKIATQLTMGFVVLLLLFLILGLFALYQSGEIEKQSEMMYSHPFKVKSTLGQLYADLLKIRIAERDLYLSHAISEKDRAVKTIHALNDSISLRFQVLYQSYLGPRADIDKAKIAFGYWKSAVDENLKLALSGEKETTAENILTSTKIRELHEGMMNSINVISNFANRKAEQLYTQSYELNKSFNRQLRMLVAGILGLTAFVIFVLLRNIRRPLHEITFATDHFHKGNLNVRSGYKSNNEFGKLSKSFNAMAEIIKQQILENEKLSKHELNKINTELGIKNAAITLSESKLERANEELNEQNEELSCQNEELSSQNEEIVRREADLAILNNDLADVSEAHRISNEYLENLFRYANTPIIVWNPDFLITRFNPAFELLTGMNASQMIGQHLKILFPPDSADEAMLQIKKTEKGRRMETVEIKIKNVKGGVYTLLWNSAPVLSNDRSTFMATIAQGYDITKRKEVETELALSEERFRTTLDNMIEGCQIIDFQWRYQYLNKAAERQSLTTKDELIGKCYTDVWPGAENTQVYAFMKQCMEDKTPHHIENEFVYPDSSTAWFDLSIQAVSQGIFIKSVDITKRKKVQNELKIANSELALQFAEKVQRTAELEIANNELVVLNIDKEKRAA
ncbi:MAG: PAS domain S-box protein, partial [Bacteroidota bacterium]